MNFSIFERVIACFLAVALVALPFAPATYEIKTTWRWRRLIACFLAVVVGAAALFYVLPAHAEFGQAGTFGGTSSEIGSNVNTQAISIANVASLPQLRGVTISWIVGSGLTNTGPAQINIDSLGLVNVYRRTSGAISALAGGEMVAGTLVEATFDGTELLLDSDNTLARLASPAFTGTPTAPTAPARTNSTQLATAAYADAASHLGSAYSSLSGNTSLTAATDLLIFANVSIPSGTCALSCVVNSTALQNLEGSTPNTVYLSCAAAVPKGATYEVTTSGGGCSSLAAYSIPLGN